MSSIQVGLKAHEKALYSPLGSIQQILNLPRAILDSLPIGVHLCDAEGLVLGYNQRAADIWGRAPVIADPSQLFCGALRSYTPEGAPLALNLAPMAQVLSTGTPARDKEVVIERPDGSRVNVIVNIEPVRDNDGQLVGAINCMLDITDRKRAEEKTREQEQWYRDLLDALPAAIYTTDDKGHITFYNQAAVDFSGREPTLGSDEWCVSWKLYTPDGTPLPHEQCPMAVALRDDLPIRDAEAVAERPDGTRVPFIPYPSPLHDAAGKVIGAVNMLVDITERKNSEKRLDLMTQELDHRAKNILAVVQAMITVTRAETVREFASVILGRIKSLSRAHSLLSESRWNGANLRRLIDDELAPYRSRDDARAQVSGPNLMLTAAGAQAIAMVVHELATNAVKYGAFAVPPGRVSVIWSRDANGGLALRWHETGGPATQPPSYRGVGLGVIERSIRDQLGGEVTFDWRKDGLVCEILAPADALASI